MHRAFFAPELPAAAAKFCRPGAKFCPGRVAGSRPGSPESPPDQAKNDPKTTKKQRKNSEKQRKTTKNDEKQATKNGSAPFGRVAKVRVKDPASGRRGTLMAL